MINNPNNNKKNTAAQIILSHLEKYPLMKIKDIYKLIFQAAMGPEHFINDKKTAYKKLYAEIDQVDTNFVIPVVEIIDPNNKLVRIHLQSYKAKSGNIDKLFEAFYITAETFESLPENIFNYWNELIVLADQNQIPFSKTELDNFFKKELSQKLVAVSHSDIYKLAYKPAYRLVLKKYLDF